MLVKIRDIPAEGVEVDLPLGAALIEEAVAPLGGSPADAARSSARARLTLSKEGETIFLRGKVGGHAFVPCSRCLTEVRAPIDVPLKMVFTPALDDDEEAEDEDGDDPLADVEHSTYAGTELDLEPLAREAMLLALPMAPLCSPGCKGLCPRCGIDWNKATCECKSPDAPEIDPRLAPLKGLKL